jgi:hypothetical protein
MSLPSQVLFGKPLSNSALLIFIHDGPCVALSITLGRSSIMGEGIYFLIIGVFLIVASLVARRYS